MIARAQPRNWRPAIETSGKKISKSLGYCGPDRMVTTRALPREPLHLLNDQGAGVRHFNCPRETILALR